jgi:hypothetical protein
MNDFSSRTSDATGAAVVTAVPRQGPGGAEAAPDRRDGTEVAVVRRSGTGWRVGDEELPDLMSAMVLADLLAAELPAPPPPVAGGSPPGSAAGGPGDAAAEAERLRVTVAQLEHALATRVRVEQAIGIVAERRRVEPKESFALLRTVARTGGTRVADLAARVVESAVNPLLILPEELARPPRQPRVRGRSPRHVRVGE